METITINNKKYKLVPEENSNLKSLVKTKNDARIFNSYSKQAKHKYETNNAFKDLQYVLDDIEPYVAPVCGRVYYTKEQLHSYFGYGYNQMPLYLSRALCRQMRTLGWRSVMQRLDGESSRVWAR